MSIFNSYDQIVDDAHTTQKLMEADIKTVSKDKLVERYTDSIALEQIYGSMMTEIMNTTKPNNNIYRIVEGIYESQRLLTKQIKYMATKENINLPDITTLEGV